MPVKCLQNACKVDEKAPVSQMSELSFYTPGHTVWTHFPTKVPYKCNKMLTECIKCIHTVKVPAKITEDLQGYPFADLILGVLAGWRKSSNHKIGAPGKGTLAQVCLILCSRVLILCSRVLILTLSMGGAACQARPRKQIIRSRAVERVPLRDLKGCSFQSSGRVQNRCSDS